MEKVWINLPRVYSDQVEKFTKTDMHIMKNISICFFIAEIDFIMKDSFTFVKLDMPDIKYTFAPAENTVFVLKNDDTNIMVKARLENNILLLEAPFTKGCHYELNIQLMLRVL